MDWRREKLTKRFIRFFDELMPDDLDEIVAHSNFEEAFGIRRGTRKARALRRDMLDRAYEHRSGLVHEGVGIGAGAGVDLRSVWRRGLLSDFAEMAILRFLEALRVSLIGHLPLEEARGHTSLLHTD